MAAHREVPVTPQLLEQILRLAGEGMVLMGGQALAFWAAYYQAPAPAIAITKDVDFLGTRADVNRLARGLGARAIFPKRNALTVLVGQVVKDLADGGYINIDVLARAYGDITARAIVARAVPAENAVGRFRVMHPLDVLQGRLENVYGLAEKQDEHGIAQLHLAVATTRRFLVDIAAQDGVDTVKPGRSIALRHIGRIETMALSDAGRKVAQRFGVHVADAIEPAPVAHIDAFVARKLPQLLKLMSAGRRAELARR